jgi:hypothetical protein
MRIKQRACLFTNKKFTNLLSVVIVLSFRLWIQGQQPSNEDKLDLIAKLLIEAKSKEEQNHILEKNKQRMNRRLQQLI